MSSDAYCHLVSLQPRTSTILRSLCGSIASLSMFDVAVKTLANKERKVLNRGRERRPSFVKSVGVDPSLKSVHSLVAHMVPYEST